MIFKTSKSTTAHPAGNRTCRVCHRVKPFAAFPERDQHEHNNYRHLTCIICHKEARHKQYRAKKAAQTHNIPVRRSRP